MIRTLAFASSLLLACSSLEGGEEPMSTYEFSGTYTTSGSWDLSSPLTGDGIAGLVADLVVFKIVELAGVPGALEDEARARVAAVVYQPVRDNVRAALPADLLPESGLMGDLGQILANVESRGEVLIVPSLGNANRLSGEDLISGLSTSFNGQVAELSIPELSGNDVLTIGGSFDASVSGTDALALDTYPVELRLAPLVVMVAEQILAIPSVAALSQQAADAIDCPSLMDTITGGANTFEITVSGESFSVDASAILSGCQAVYDEIGSYVLGLFSTDTGVSLGGGLRVSDANGDGVVDGLTSDASYRGELTSLPLPIPVPFDATYSATRSAVP